MPTLEGQKTSLPTPPPGRGSNTPRSFRWVIWLILGFTFFFLMRSGEISLEGGAPQEISYSQLNQWLGDGQALPKIRTAILTERILRGELEDGRRFKVNLPDPNEDPDLIRLLRERVPNFRIEPLRTFWLSFFFNLGGPLLLMAAFWLLLYRGAAHGGGRLLSFGKSRARQVLPEEGQRITFQDVAGVNEAKEELQEVIEFLKDPKKFQRLGGKIPKGVLLLGPPGCGKCVVGETLVATNKGMMAIQDIPKYFSVDMDNRVCGAKVRTVSLDRLEPVWADATHWFALGEQPTIRLRTDLGLSLEGTPEHPIVVLTPEGDLEFRRLDQLRIGDMAALPYGWQSFGEREWVDSETAYLLGLLVGDGGMTIRSRISFTSQESELVDFVRRYTRQRYHYELRKATSRPYDYVIMHDPLREDLVRFGLTETYADGKRIPEWVLMSAKPTVAAFLRGLFDTDGSVERGGVLVTLSSASQTLIQQVSQLLLSFGVVHILRTRTKRYNGRLHYYLVITGDFLEVFEQEIGFGLTRKRERLHGYLSRTCRNTNIHLVPHQGSRLKAAWSHLVRLGLEPSNQVDPIWLKNLYRYINGTRRPSVGAFRKSVEVMEGLHPGVRAVAEFQQLKRLADANLMFAKVSTLQSSQAAVYDFTVAQEHSFIANGFINHNTLLAKAVAGEAGVPFFSISGSDFVEMFVGVGASRVRDLFEQAKKSAKVSGRGCIIFIDEIDAVGRQRFAGIGGGHDEREQTLNALLVEMDGFNTQEGVILVAATNRPDVLDPALLRPGRFDRQIVIDRPDLRGREEILKVHIRKIKLAKEVDLKSIARQTPGFSGADLANLCNEAALLAARYDKEEVGMFELEAAMERVMAGPERKSRVISPYEKSIVACHEAGHALVSMMIPGSDPVHKVSIIPRGTAALGYTMQTPLEDRYIMTRKELLNKLAVLMGGRTAEELTFGELTTGAQNDLEVATEIARRMVCEYGMSDRLGTLTYGERQGMVFLGRDIAHERNYSDQTAVIIDQEIHRIIEECHERARAILLQHKTRLKKLCDVLLEKEVLDGDEAKRIVMAEGAADEGAAPSAESEQLPG